MKNVVGLFENMRDAEAVVRELRDAGISDADISFAGRNPDAATMEANAYTGEGHNEAAEGAGFGATGGTIVGGLTGLLVGLGALTIPGIGPVVAAGTLATALGSTALGAGIGAATGGLLGALVGAGIPEEDAHIYSEGIRRGGALVMAQVDDTMVDPTLDIMERYNVVDIDERGTEYRSGGWSRFDENSGAYSDSSYADRDRAVNDDDYDRSSKVGTVGGAVAGAAAGAAIGSVGGPVGTVVGGAAGAVTGGAVGAAGDAAGAAASEGGYDATGTTYGGTTNTNYNRATDYDTSGAMGAGMPGITGTPYDGINDASVTGTTGGSVGGTTDMGTTGTYDRTADTGFSSAVGGTTDTGYSGTGSTTGSTGSTRYRSRTYEVGNSMSGHGTSGGTMDNMASRIEEATERGIDTDLNRDGGIGQSDHRNNY